MMTLVDYLITIVGSSVVVGGVAYLAKDFLRQYFARDLEHYKNQLTREADDRKHELTKELEKFKRELDGLMAERQTRFSLMHQKRAEVIAKLYGLISPAERSMKRVTALLREPYSDKEEEAKRQTEERDEAAKTYIALQEYLDTHRIYLSEDTAKVFDQLLSQLYDAYIQYTASQRRSHSGSVDQKQWVEAWKRATQDVPRLKVALEKEFRRILGITD
jgi:hypothetical protein